MKSSLDDRTSFSIVPPQYRCVWMSAGLLSYQLCDKDFNCEDCPLDKAMNMHFIGQRDTEEGRTRSLPVDPAPGEQRYAYSRNHCWILTLADNVVRVGIEPMLASLLGSPREIVLPRAGEPLLLDKFTCWIVVDDDAFPLASPISGTTLRTNEALRSDPQFISTHPLTDGWIFEARLLAGQPKQRTLLPKEDAETKYASDFSHFNESLTTALEPASVGVGMTLQDGGPFLQSVVQMVGSKTYLSLLHLAFCR